jgi:hypothetical protein
MRHPSNTGNHPIQPERENTAGATAALIAALPDDADVLSALRAKVAERSHIGLAGVYEALVQSLPEDQRPEWNMRWVYATNVETRRRDYDRDYDRSLASISWGR